jgi:hemerythrin superfamily protein
VDPTKLLEADHRAAEDLIEEIREAEGDEKMRLLRTLETELRGHMQIEEQVLYPAMVPVTGAEPVEEGTNEHDVARTALAEVLRLAPDEPGFPSALDALEAAIEHHVEDEEEDVFPKLRDEGEEILGDVLPSFLDMRRGLGMPLDGERLAKGLTKEELLDEARSAGIDGTSDMDKGELADAVAARVGS